MELKYLNSFSAQIHRSFYRLLLYKLLSLPMGAGEGILMIGFRPTSNLQVRDRMLGRHKHPLIQLALKPPHARQCACSTARGHILAE